MPPLIPISAFVFSTARCKSRGGELLTCDIYCRHYILFGESVRQHSPNSFLLIRDPLWRRPWSMLPNISIHRPISSSPVWFASRVPHSYVMTVSRVGHMGLLPHQMKMINSFIFGLSGGQTPKRWALML